MLLGWTGLCDDNGKDIPYSREKAIELLRDPALNDLYDWILAMSANADAFRVDLEEEVVGNSVPTSSGS